MTESASRSPSGASEGEGCLLCAGTGCQLTSGSLPRTLDDHWNQTRALGCVVTRRWWPTLHHVHGGSVSHVVKKGLGQKTPDALVIPLSAELHSIGPLAIDGQLGVRRWEERFGTQLDHLTRVSSLLRYCPFALEARLRNESSSRRSSRSRRR